MSFWKFKPKNGDVVVCLRGGRWIAGTVATFECENIGTVNSIYQALSHRRLPCGFVSLTHCEKMRLATEFERQVIQEMEVGLAVHGQGFPAVVMAVPANQWGS